MDNATASAMHQHRHDSDEYRRIELITGSVRRRRWTAPEKAAIIAESLQPQVNVSELAGGGASIGDCCKPGAVRPYVMLVAVPRHLCRSVLRTSRRRPMTHWRSIPP
jgi:hypothetical protein